jgi:EmrB/QacA subfamily drug resistance transporter
MVILDGSIVAVALPAIGADLDVTGADSAWVVNAYLIPFGGLLLLAGRLGDLLGSRRVLLVGLVVFTSASFLCGVATSIGPLIAARFIQGVGGALASAVVLGMVVTLFPDQAERSRALGVFAFVGAAGSSIGLLAGGVLTAALSWPWIFLVNVPLGVAGVVGVRQLVPNAPGSRGRADVVGALLATSGLVLAVYALLSTETEDAAPAGWSSGGQSSVLGLAAGALLLAFVIRQRATDTPLLPLRLLASRATGLGNLVQALMVAGLFGYQFLGVLYLQQVLGYGPLGAGLAYLPVPLVIAVVSLTATARLTARLGERPILVAGLAGVTAGLGLLTRLPADDGYLPVVLPAGLLIAVGFGLAAPVLAGIAVGSAPARDAGVASGLFTTAQQVGGALGLAVLTSLATAGSGVSASLAGFHLAFGAAAGFSGVALLLALGTVASSCSNPDDRPRVSDGQEPQES